MKWYKYVLFMILFLVPNVIHAECSNSEIVQYQEQAKNINITYDYTEHENSYVLFTIKIANLTPGLYIQDSKSGTDYHYTGSDITIDNYNSGNTYRFKIFTDGGNCSDTLITKKYVTLPYYNVYYKDPICEGIEDYRYCQKWAKVILPYDEFYKKVTTYKNSLLSDEENTNTNISNYCIFIFLLNIYIKYYYIILPIIIIGGYIIIHRHNKKQDLF